MKQRSKILLVALLCMVMVFAMLPLTASASLPDIWDSAAQGKVQKAVLVETGTETLHTNYTVLNAPVRTDYEKNEGYEYFLNRVNAVYDISGGKDVKIQIAYDSGMNDNNQGLDSLWRKSARYFFVLDAEGNVIANVLNETPDANGKNSGGKYEISFGKATETLAFGGILYTIPNAAFEYNSKYYVVVGSASHGNQSGKRLFAPIIFEIYTSNAEGTGTVDTTATTGTMATKPITLTILKDEGDTTSTAGFNRLEQAGSGGGGGGGGGSNASYAIGTPIAASVPGVEIAIAATAAEGKTFVFYALTGEGENRVALPLDTFSATGSISEYGDYRFAMPGTAVDIFAVFGVANTIRFKDVSTSDPLTGIEITITDSTGKCIFQPDANGQYIMPKGTYNYTAVDPNGVYATKQGTLTVTDSTTYVIEMNSGTYTAAMNSTENSLQLALEKALDGAALSTVKNLTITTTGEGIVLDADDFTYLKSGATALVELDLSGAAVADNKIPNQALRELAALTTVALPDSITFIGNQAFRNCTSLTTINLPAGLTTLDGRAFDSCAKLGGDEHKIEITNTVDVVSAPGNPFQGIDAITVVVPANLYSAYTAEGSAWTGYNNVTIQAKTAYEVEITADAASDSLEEALGAKLGSNALSTVTKLTITTTGEGVVIDADDFTYLKNGATALVELDLSGAAVADNKIPNQALRGLTALTTVALPDSITFIGNQAFRNCTGLTTINLPAGLTTLDGRAFDTCTALGGDERKIEITNTTAVVSASGNPFQNAGDITVIVPNDLYYAYKAHEIWSTFTNVTIQPKTPIEDTDAVITEFAALDAAIATQNVANGTAESALTLPATLSVTTTTGSANAAVTWTASPAYAPLVAGTYVFTAELLGGYVLGEGVTAPTITVKVAIVAESVTAGADGYYVISTSEQMQWLSNYLNADAANLGIKIRLGADIDMANVSWIAPTGEFTGIFDGNSKKLSNVSVPLLAIIGADGIVKNVGIESGTLNMTTPSGVIADTNNGTIKNCYNNAVVTCNSVRGAGIAYTNASTGIIEGCYNSGTFTAIGGTVHIGGITGSNKGIVKNCYNSGDITATGRASGIVATGSGSGIVDGCYNSGKVYGNCPAGIVAYAFSNDGVIKNCYNIGEVTGRGVTAGGIVGQAALNITVSNCYNAGMISTEGEDTSLGSIAGKLNDGKTPVYSYCFSNGELALFGDDTNTYENCALKSDADMKAAGFVTELNGAGDYLSTSFVYVENSYPQLSWQRKITAFAALDAAIATQNVANGTAQSALNLPATLSATINDASEDVAVTWTAAPTYAPTTAGTYVFTAELASGYVLGEGVTAPVINVIVEPVPSGVIFPEDYFPATPVDPVDPGTTPDEPVVVEPVEYTDVAASDWHYEAIQFVSTEGLFKGYPEGDFQPDATMTRAMIYTVLYRAAGEPEVDASVISFTDCAQDAWYSAGIAWAVSNKLVSGYTDGTVGINDPVTREQLAVILMRYAAAEGKDVSGRADITAFPDAAETSGYAADSVKWAVSAGIIGGTNTGELDPQAEATRAQVATMLMRFFK